MTSGETTLSAGLGVQPQESDIPVRVGVVANDGYRLGEALQRSRVSRAVIPGGEATRWAKGHEMCGEDGGQDVHLRAVS